MKKTISVILCAFIVLSSCFVTAFAADENIGFTEINFAPTPEYDDDTTLIINFDKKYVSFGEDISVEITTYTADDDNIDRDETDETNATFTTVTFSGDDLVPVEEDPADYADELYDGSFITLYVPHAGNIDYYNFYKAEIPENTVFDGQGNGNKKMILTTMCQSFMWGDTDCGYFTDNNAFEKCTVWFKLSSYTPVDFYLDGELVAENSVYCQIEEAEKGTHTISAKKFGIVLDETTFYVNEIDKAATIGALFLEAGSYLLTSLWSVPLSGLLFLIFPPLGIAGLATPFVSIGAFFSAIIQSVALLFR